MISRRPEILRICAHLAPDVCTSLSTLWMYSDKPAQPCWCGAAGTSDGSVPLVSSFFSVSVSADLRTFHLRESAAGNQRYAEVFMCLWLFQSYLFLIGVSPLCCFLVFLLPYSLSQMGKFSLEVFTCSDSISGGPCSCQCVVFRDKDKHSL